MSDFWTRRKAAVQEQERDDALAMEAQQQEHREAELAEHSDEDILAELDLPNPDLLEEGDDFKAYLTDAVPARIRTRALRRLWRVNPVLANVDGLVDYGEDFNDASFIVENMQTAYQVGKGMTAHVKELARKLEEAGEEQTISAEDLEEHEIDQSAANVEDVEQGANEPEDTSSHTIEDPEDLALAAPSRRMRFTFDPQTDASHDAAHV